MLAQPERRRADQRRSGERATLFPDRTAGLVERVRPNQTGSTRTLTPAGPRPPRLAKAKSLKKLNVVDQGQRKNRTSLVRRQAANTSLNRDQGSIHFYLFSFFFFFIYYSLSVMCNVALMLFNIFNSAHAFLPILSIFKQ